MWLVILSPSRTMTRFAHHPRLLVDSTRRLRSGPLLFGSATRAVAPRNSGLATRGGVDFTSRLSRIAEAVRSLSADEALIDGEAVVFRDYGRSAFY